MNKLILLITIISIISGCSKQQQPIIINKNDTNKSIYFVKSDGTFELYNTNNELLLKFNNKNTDSLSLSTLNYIHNIEKEQKVSNNTNIDSIYITLFSKIADNLDKNKFLMIGYDTIFTVSITLLVVILNQRFIKKHEIKKDIVSLNNTKIFFFSGIDNLIKPIEKEISNLDELIGQISEQKERDYIFQDAIEISFDFYDKSDPVELFNSLTKYINDEQKVDIIKNYSILLKSITSVKNYKLNKINNYNDFITKLSFYSIKCGDNFKEMMYQIDDIIERFKKSLANVNDDKFMGKIVEIIKNANNPKADLYYTANNVVMPITELYQLTGDGYGRIFSRNATAFNAAFGNYKRWKELNIKKYQNEVSILKSSLNNIQNSVNILKQIT